MTSEEIESVRVRHEVALRDSYRAQEVRDKAREEFERRGQGLWKEMLDEDPKRAVKATENLIASREDVLKLKDVYLEAVDKYNQAYCDLEIARVELYIALAPLGDVKLPIP